MYYTNLREVMQFASVVVVVALHVAVTGVQVTEESDFAVLLILA
jgi:hypothetical protein